MTHGVLRQRCLERRQWGCRGVRAFPLRRAQAGERCAVQRREVVPLLRGWAVQPAAVLRGAVGSTAEGKGFPISISAEW